MKHCSYCGVDIHDDRECSRTRPADWTPNLPAGVPLSSGFRAFAAFGRKATHERPDLSLLCLSSGLGGRYDPPPSSPAPAQILKLGRSCIFCGYVGCPECEA